MERFIVNNNMILEIRGFINKKDKIGYIIKEDLLRDTLFLYDLPQDYITIKKCKDKLFNIFKDREKYIMISIYENKEEL